jgi:hypothetical protein
MKALLMNLIAVLVAALIFNVADAQHRTRPSSNPPGKAPVTTATSKTPGGIVVTGGAGGNASGPGSKGGAGGDAILVLGNGNTVINGNVTFVKGSTGKGSSSSGGGGGGGGGSPAGGAGASVESSVVSGASVVAGTNGTATDSTAPKSTNDASPEQAVEQTQRYLQLKNDSGSKLKVWLQYHTLGAKNTWSWVPADPATSDKTLTFELEAGQEGYVQQQGKKITANRVRLWAKSETGQWLEFKDTDLWLVPEQDKEGVHRYFATEIKTFTFVFPRPAASK